MSEKTTRHFDDVCVAIGVAVLERFAEDESVTVVTVKRDGEGGYWIGDDE